MKILSTILFVLMLCSLYGQKNAFPKEEATIPFDYYKKQLTEEAKEKIDLLWDELKPGHVLELHLLSKEEQKKLSNDHKFKLSGFRADSVATYLHRKRIGAKYTSFNINYFDHVTNGKCGTNASYKAFTKRKGIISVLVEKDTYYQKYYPHSESSTLSNTCNKYDLYPEYSGIIEGSQGTLIKFPPNCFRGHNFKGLEKVEVLLCEYYTMNDILFSGLTTANYDQIIETGGMVFIEVKYKDEVLSLKSDETIQIFFPNNSGEEKKGMQSFDGKKRNGLINWELNKKAKNRTIKEGESVFDTEAPTYDEELEEMEGEGEGYYSEVDGYLMKTSKMGFINCDRFYDVKQKVDLIVKVNSSSQFSTRLVFKDIKSVLPGYSYSPNKDVKFANLPKGEEAYVVVYNIAKDKKKGSFAYQKITLGEESKINITPQEMSVADLKSEIDALFN